MPYSAERNLAQQFPVQKQFEILKEHFRNRKCFYSLRVLDNKKHLKLFSSSFVSQPDPGWLHEGSPGPAAWLRSGRLTVYKQKE